MTDHCLRLFVILKAAEVGAGERESAWHLIVALFALPPIFLAPFLGAICNSLPKRWVLVGSAAYCLAVVLAFVAWNGGWYACLGLLAVGMALYAPVRYALLPAAARDTQVPLPRVNGWIEMGAVSAIIAGMILGGALTESAEARGPSSGQQPQIAFWTSASWPLTPPLAALGLSLVAVIAALPVSFASDVRRPEKPAQAVAGFFQDCGRVFRQADTRGSLLAW